MRDFLTKGGPLLIPFLCFLRWGRASTRKCYCKANFAGILLGVLTTFVGGFFNIRADRLVGGTGIAGRRPPVPQANAVATPLAIARPTLKLAEVAAAAAPAIASAVTGNPDASVDLTGLRKNRRVRLLWRKTHENDGYRR